jgi:plasmid maintenance system antidote protein VapI
VGYYSPITIAKFLTPVTIPCYTSPMSVVQDKLAETTYTYLASRLKCSKAYLSFIFGGKRRPTLEFTKRLAKELGCSVEELMSELGLTAGDSHNWMGRQSTPTVSTVKSTTA